ncbi:hypothetical protein FACS189421_13800 [Bacteroidia bacterium]|nr:hypothetical protein FACS189421_13800 [Bacteroidia bacterium]GHT49392.1 hypothetical protein FACS189440_15090 [Bacteroidia bacterium]
MEAKVEKEVKVESWESMKERYPDRFVLIENPEFKEKYSPELLKGVFRYKHKSKKMVVKKELELKPHHSTIQYTGGRRLDKFNEIAMVL